MVDTRTLKKRFLSLLYREQHLCIALLSENFENMLVLDWYAAECLIGFDMYRVDKEIMLKSRVILEELTGLFERGMKCVRRRKGSRSCMK